jgi:hypothetical protein
MTVLLDLDLVNLFRKRREVLLQLWLGLDRRGGDLFPASVVGGEKVPVAGRDVGIEGGRDVSMSDVVDRDEEFLRVEGGGVVVSARVERRIRKRTRGLTGWKAFPS